MASLQQEIVPLGEVTECTQFKQNTNTLMWCAHVSYVHAWGMLCVDAWGICWTEQIGKCSVWKWVSAWGMLGRTTPTQAWPDYMCVCSAVKSVIVCQVLSSVTKCCQVLPWCCHGDLLFTLFPQVYRVLKWWLAVGDRIVGNWLLAQIQPIRLLYLPMDHHLQSNTICFTERVIKSHRLMTVPVDTCVCKHSPECW